MDGNDQSKQIAFPRIVSTEQYMANANNITQLKGLVEQLENENEVSHKRYELMRRIQAGREAEQMLAQLSGPNQPLLLPPSSQGASSSYANVPQLQYNPAHRAAYSTVPSTASIVEVSTPKHNRTSRASSSGRSFVASVPDQPSNHLNLSSSATSSAPSGATSGPHQSYSWHHYAPPQTNGVHSGANTSDSTQVSFRGVVPQAVEASRQQLSSGRHQAVEASRQQLSSGRQNYSEVQYTQQDPTLWQPPQRRQSYDTVPFTNSASVQSQHQSVLPAHQSSRHQFQQTQYNAMGANANVNTTASYSLEGALGKPSTSTSYSLKKASPAATTTAGLDRSSKERLSTPVEGVAARTSNPPLSYRQVSASLMDSSVPPISGQNSVFRASSQASAALMDSSVPPISGQNSVFRASSQASAPLMDPLVPPVSGQNSVFKASSQAPTSSNMSTKMSNTTSSGGNAERSSDLGPKSTTTTSATVPSRVNVNEVTANATEAQARAYFQAYAKARSQAYSQYGQTQGVPYTNQLAPYQPYSHYSHKPPAQSGPHHSYYSMSAASTFAQTPQSAQLQQSLPVQAANANLSASSALARPVTPPSAKPPSPKTPAKADKARLARDILRSLGKPNGSLAPTKSNAYTIPSQGQSSLTPATSIPRQDVQPKAVEPQSSDRIEQHRIVDVVDNTSGVEAAAPAKVEPIKQVGVVEALNMLMAMNEPQDNGRIKRKRSEVEVNTNGANGSVNKKQKGKSGLESMPHDPSDSHMETLPNADVVMEESFEFHLEPDNALAQAQSAPAQSALPNAPYSPVHGSPINLSSPEIGTGPVAGPSAAHSPISRDSQPAPSNTSPAQPPPENIDMKERIPLFLPSPTRSPSRGIVDDEVIAVASDGGGGLQGTGAPASANVSSVKAKKNKNRRKEVYVLAPPSPAWVIQDLQKSHEQGKRVRPKSRVVATDLVGLPVFISDEEREPKLTEEQLKQEEEKRRKAEEIEQVSMTRLRPRPCAWKFCDAVLSSVEKLCQHVEAHAREKEDQITIGSHVCRWKDCSKRLSEVSKLVVHLQNHARTPIFCPYSGCDENFRTAKELHSHAVHKHKDDRIRPSAEPNRPELRQALTPLCETCPSYMEISRVVGQTPISAARHAQIGPWVLRKISGPVNLQYAQYNAAAPLRGSRRLAAESDKSLLADIENSRHDEYDFLGSLSMDPPDYCDYLPCSEVTQLLLDGLVLWGPNTPEVESKEEEPDVEFTPSPSWETPYSPANHPFDGMQPDARSVSTDELRLRDNDCIEMDRPIARVGGERSPSLIPSGDEEAVLVEMML